MESPASTRQALEIIERSAWAAALLVAFFMAGITWLGFRARALTLARYERLFLVNSLTAIGFVLAFVASALLLNAAVEPAAQLQARVGVFCLPPSRLQLLLPLFAGIASGAAFLAFHRHRSAV